MLLMTLRPIVTAPGVSPLARITWQVNVAALYWMTAANDECIAAADEGLRLADTYGIHLWDMFLCTQAVFGRLFKAGNVTAAEPYYARMTQQVNPARIMDAAFLHYLLGPKFFFLNDLDQAQAQLERALALGNETAYVWGLPHIMIDLGRVLFYQGKHAQALATVRAARDEKVVGYLSSTHEYLAYLTEAELALLTNDESACAEALRHSLAVGARQRFQNHTWWRNDLMARLYAKALAHGIEVSYVRHMIEKRGLLPPKDDPVPDTWPFLIKIYTLGSFVLHKDDEPVRFAIKAQRKPLELLKALIVFGGEEVSELTLCDALWPDADADLARQNLKATLHRVRKLVGPETIVLMDGKVSINDRRCWVDAWAFERQIDRTLDLRKDAADPGQLAAATDAAVKLYRGPFLATEDLSFVHIARERLRGKFLRAIGRLADVLQANGEPERSISYLEKGLELDPLAEQFYQGLMRAYMKLGRCADVLKTHERCRMNLHASLRVAPSPETEALRQQARVTAN
jgi:LuxR family maltose regulon positive regulatory protein